MKDFKEYLEVIAEAKTYNPDAFANFLKTVPKIEAYFILGILKKASPQDTGWTGLDAKVYNEETKSVSDKGIYKDKKGYFFKGSAGSSKTGTTSNKIRIPMEDWYPEALI